MNTEHLDALESALCRERARLSAATADAEIALRTAWVAQLEREVAGERKFLALPADPAEAPMTDAELLAKLGLS